MSDDCSQILDWLLCQSPADQQSPVESIGDWKSRYDTNAAEWSVAVDRAVSAGFLADRTAYAFLAGFFAALQHLVPDYVGDRITAFCISEEGGAHPRAIKTYLKKQDSETWSLTGRKQFITCAEYAEAILVAASVGIDDQGRNQIRLAHIDRNSEGVRVEPMPDLPFIPEIKHGVVHLEDVSLREDQLLPGDGYNTYIKPFRTVEDIHVSAGIMAYLLRCAVFFDWPQAIREELLGLIAATRPLAMADALSSSVHIALAGVQRSLDVVIAGLDDHWQNAPDTDRDAWERDKAVLGIAKKARAVRLQSAWKKYKTL